ncbi:AurF N-oxygenase family protein [Streptomyces alkaliphilus]|uniref:AurF N-oxygenase family protein n=1 Tax=Streptomyces alkaliphilus TaxID=1472722 RepID=UPI00117D43B0|nr:diiron oxygenase [Streptomyces alkaliphilus]MQS06768.1 diiron oxygenase [Streptomyces alkaliphilus]
MTPPHPVTRLPRGGVPARAPEKGRPPGSSGTGGEDIDFEALRDALGALRDRERVAERLLASSARHSFDPDTELDWESPPVAGLWYWPPELVSLYDTPLWYRMSEEQRVDLSRHEAAALASLGIWFELILMQLLVRHIYDKAMTSSHVRYALTEIADECRHSMMFARAIRWTGAPAYPVSRRHHNLGRLFKTFSTTPGSFTATLLGEEVLDWMQRLTFPDERVQPLIRGVTRIHVVEEARHVRYAREELRRQMLTAPRWDREFTRLSCGEFARVFSVAFINPEVYTRVGLDRREAVAQVRASEHRRAVMRDGAHKLTGFLDGIGVLRGPARRMWRQSGLLA